MVVWDADRVETPRLEHASRDLVAAAGHELKTPLSIVLGLCRRMLTVGELADSHATDVERIRSNVYVLLKRVDELLLAARLDSGRVELETSEIDVARLVHEICDDFRSVAQTRDQTLAVTAPPRAIAAVDEEKLLSIVSNLLANALKFAPVGGHVRCAISERRRRLRIEVADDGPGVPRGLRKEVFERYRQAPGAASRPAGTGLGLAMVRELVALHGGTVTLTDAPEGGALFVVELPRRAPAWARRAAIAPEPTAHGHRIDVAERQRATVEQLRAELAAEDRRRERGPRVIAVDAARALVVSADAQLGAFVAELVEGSWHVTHAVDAVHAARRHRAAAHHVVLLDAAAGTSVVQALRESLPDIPVLAFACDAEDVAALMHAGAEDCVIKPFTSEELLARLAALSARTQASARREAAFAGLDRAFDVAPTPMALVAAGGELLRANGALCRLLGRTEPELLRRSVKELSHPDDLRGATGRGGLAFPGRSAIDRRVRRLARADGSYVRARVSISLVGGGDGRGRCQLWHISDVTSDGWAPGTADVSGAPGRRALERALRQQVLRCERYAEQAALVRCSLDDLPAIRREHGADAADRLVQSIVEAVRGRLRDTDVVAFVGGHELAALLAHADGEAANVAAVGIRDAVQRQRVVTPHGSAGTVATVGVAAVAGSDSPGRAFLAAGIALEGARNAEPGSRRTGPPPRKRRLGVPGRDTLLRTAGRQTARQ